MRNIVILIVKFFSFYYRDQIQYFIGLRNSNTQLFYVYLMRGRFLGVQGVFSRPKTNSKKQLSGVSSMSSIQLPSIHSRSLHLRNLLITLDSSNDVRRQICKFITFSKQRGADNQEQLYSKLPEEVKGLLNSGERYRSSLELVNKMFGCCSIALREKDVILVEGKQSQSMYLLVTNGPYRPKSVCCQENVVIKIINKHGIEDGLVHPRLLQAICLGCQKIILKISQKQSPKPDFVQKRRKLLDFALHIASGRYKKHKMQDDPINDTLDHIKSRVCEYIKR